MGEYFAAGFHKALANKTQLKEYRQKGMMIGIELNEPCTELVGLAADKGLLINVTAGNIIRLLPPLIMNESQADQVIEIISSLIQ
jgi:acetylornithine aminotransferase